MKHIQLRILRRPEYYCKESPLGLDLLIKKIIKEIALMLKNRLETSRNKKPKLNVYMSI